MKANDQQIGGDHYKIGGEEHWDRAWRLGWDPFQYQITKYVERWKKKGGIEDLRKARHFLDKYIELNTKPEFKPIEPRQDPTKWNGFTFEGQLGDGKILYKCLRCKTEVWVPEGRDPQAFHLCDFKSAEYNSQHP